MKTKLAISALVAVFALTAVIASLIAVRPAMTQTVPPTPPPPPTAPTPPQPVPTLAPVELEEFVGSLCSNLDVQDLSGYFQADQVHLGWYTSYYDGPHIGPRYDGYDVHYRIERLLDQKGEGARVWYWVAAVTNDNWWAGPADPGQWIYRVAVFSITKNGQTLSCQGGLKWSKVVVAVPAPLTPDEFAEFAGSLCDQLVVHDLNAHLLEDTLQLNWYTSYYDDPYVGPRYDNYDVVYRVERRPDQPDSDQCRRRTYWLIWQDRVYVAHVNRATRGKVRQNRVDGFTEWRSPPSPRKDKPSGVTETRGGRRSASRFRRKRNSPWRQLNAKSCTAEITRCAKEALTNNISDEALPIITSYIERTVAEQVAHIDDLDELAGFTVTVCAQGNGADDGANAVNLWLLLLLLDLGF